MLTEQITSRQNPLVKRARRVRDGQDPGHMFVEGLRLVEEIVQSDLPLEALIYTTELAESVRGAALLETVAGRRCRGAHVPVVVMKAICDVEAPQGIVALAAHPRFELDEAFAVERPLVVVLDGLQDPGNVGAIVRTAEAAGASGIVTTPGTAEPYSAKALRASMGSAFRLPVVRRVDIGNLEQIALTRGVSILAASASDGMSYTEVDWREPAMILIGNEGAGLSSTARRIATASVSIQMSPEVESLNAAVATGILLFEAARQRRSKKRKR